ncbi:hypothetical protein G6011_05861 [Alternaria panax]|uniref:Rhodopsin domain-containing protein n=1 Tax=Alternaria panax TaxID=48097 RepID=A0AAD4FFF7_9PLEO|nr:hypothetical protein G6011_05861 [Alternaria panax]
MPVRSKTRMYKTVNVVFFVLATVAISGRYAAHIIVGRMQWLNDGNMGVVLVLNSVLFATTYKMAFDGLGQDMWKVPFEQITTMLHFFWISEIVYFNLVGFIKIAFLLFFLQIFPQKRFRATIWGFVILNIASVIAFSFAIAFICSPVSFMWKRLDGKHEGHCGNNNALVFSHAGFSIILDLVTLALPVAQIWKLQLKTKKKIGVLSMFSVGAFVTVVSILRLRSLVSFARTKNLTWDYLEAALWSIIEVNVGIICACMPSIRLGLVQLFPTLLGSTNQSVSKPQYGGRAA